MNYMFAYQIYLEAVTKKLIRVSIIASFSYMRTLNFKTQLLVASLLSIEISTTNKLLKTTITTRKTKNRGR